MKDGKSTSEFWLTVAAEIMGTVMVVIGLLQEAGHIAGNGVVATVAGAAVAVLAALGYNASRAKIKSAPPPGE